MVEIIGVIFTLLYVFLIIKNNVIAWPFGIIGCIAYFIIFLQQGLVLDSMTQIVFIVQCIIGWWNWKRPEKEFPLSWSRKRNTMVLISITILICLSLSIISTLIGGKMSILDGLTTSMSITGTYLLTKKKIDSWVYWIIVDSVFIFLFWISGLYLSSCLYLVLLIMAIIGLRRWISLK